AIAANDIVAMGMLAKAEEAGIGIPSDMAIVGYDVIPAARLLRPALTTVALRPQQIGKRAVELLLDRRRPGDPPPTARRVSAPPPDHSRLDLTPANTLSSLP
ncbi:MAG: substrate-binding domain-containing protein, partial [Chloroflexota bacterium]|nr:substrate-binding domain-containing protein [Chloroflexota bacterium]